MWELKTLGTGFSPGTKSRDGVAYRRADEGAKIGFSNPIKNVAI